MTAERHEGRGVLITGMHTSRAMESNVLTTLAGPKRWLSEKEDEETLREGP